MSFWDLYSLIIWDRYTILLTFGFFVAAGIGYYLIYQQIRLVKAETISIWDHFKCGLYAIVFACGVTIILTTLVAFRIDKKLAADTSYLSLFLLWPLNFVILLLYTFPLVDFLYMAHSNSNKGLTLFQEFFARKIIHKFDDKWKRYLIAASLWIFLFLLPPLLLSIAIPWYIAVMGWSFIYPIVIIAYLGNRGYVSGVVKNTYTHHTMERSLHLAFDKSPRIFRVIFYRFFTTVMLIVQIVVYVVMLVVFILLTIYFIVGDVRAVKGTAFQTFVISLSFLFGIIGYFNRFWSKKIKFRWIDVLLSAWLIASVGINILVNFMILRIENGIAPIFESWYVTSIITSTSLIHGGNYVLFIPVALIEECMFLILVNYYLFGKKSDYFLETRLNLTALSGSNFIPIPLFNFVHHSNPQLRRAAKEELIQMYGRLPLRNDLKYTHKRYMNPLFDAICDSNKYNQEVARIILENAIDQHPKKISSQINKALQSGNVDMQLNVGNIVKNYTEFVAQIPPAIVANLFAHSNYHIQRLGAELLLSLTTLPSSISKQSIMLGINGGDYEFQGKCMEIATKFGLMSDINELLEKVKGSKPHLQQVAIQSFVGLLNRDDVQLSSQDIKRLLDELQGSNTSSREAAIISLSKIKDLIEHKVPIEPFIAGLKSQIQTVRDASERALKKLMPNLRTSDQSKIFSTFLSLSETADEDTIRHLIPLLAENWKQYPQKVISILIKVLKSSDDITQKIAQQALIKIAIDDPERVLNALVPLQEERTYLLKSITQQTIHKICSTNPEAILILERFIIQTNITIKKNALNAMEELSEEFASFFNQTLLVEEIQSEQFVEIRLKLLSVLSNVIQRASVIDKQILGQVLPLLNDRDKDIRKRVANLCVDITKADSSAIELSTIQTLSSDPDPSIRESSAKMLQYYIPTHEEESLVLLKALLQDDKWVVQSASIESLMQNELQLDKDLINSIIGMIDQPDQWLSRKILEFIQKIGKKNAELIPTERIIELSSHPNSHIRSMVLKIIELLPFNTVWDILLLLMQDEEEQVRDQAARSLVLLSKDMTISTLFTHTLHFFSDETNILLQRSIANALQRILKYENPEARNRLISILKIRCKISQDPVLCQIWHELEEK